MVLCCDDKDDLHGSKIYFCRTCVEEMSELLKLSVSTLENFWESQNKDVVSKDQYHKFLIQKNQSDISSVQFKNLLQSLHNTGKIFNARSKIIKV